MFKNYNADFLPSSRMRLLTDAEIALVSGGDDGSCSAGGDCGSSSGSDSGGSIGTLGEVTVNGNQGALTDGDATNLVNNIDTAMSSPAIALFFFGLTAVSWMNSLHSTPALGNPMGDPSPGSP